MMKNFYRQMLLTHSTGIHEVTTTPPSVDVTGARPGDTVVCLQSDNLFAKGEKFTVVAYDPQQEMVRIEIPGKPSKEETVADARRFCLESSINPTGIYIRAEVPQAPEPLEFAGRKVWSHFKNHFDTSAFPYKKLRRERFLEMEHDLMEFCHQGGFCTGVSRFYLASHEGYWFLIQWLKTDTAWIFDEDYSEWYLVFMTQRMAGDRKSEIALLLMTLWIYQYQSKWACTDIFPLMDIDHFFTILRTGWKKSRYLHQESFRKHMLGLDQKNLDEASAIVEELVSTGRIAINGTIKTPTV